MADEEDIMLKLKSGDEQTFEIKKSIAIQSGLIKDMCESLDDDQVLPLPNMKGEILSKIVAFMNLHADNAMPEIEKPLKSAKLEDLVPAWDAAFVDVEQETLFELIMGANFLN